MMSQLKAATFLIQYKGMASKLSLVLIIFLMLYLTHSSAYALVRADPLAKELIEMVQEYDAGAN